MMMVNQIRAKLSLPSRLEPEQWKPLNEVVLEFLSMPKELRDHCEIDLTAPVFIDHENRPRNHLTAWMIETYASQHGIAR